MTVYGMIIIFRVGRVPQMTIYGMIIMFRIGRVPQITIYGMIIMFRIIMFRKEMVPQMPSHLL